MARTALLTVLALAACSSPEAPPETKAPAEQSEKPPITRVNGERSDLLFRYRTDEGMATTTTLAEVPEAARAAVQVVDLSRSPEQRRAGAFVQVFDLRAPGADGLYPGKRVPRADLEAQLAQLAAERAPKQAPLVMYSATWCGVCTQARKFLTKQKVAFVEKLIDKDPAAEKELAEKARAAGVSANGVPVFEVGGRLINGFDPQRLMTAVRGG